MADRVLYRVHSPIGWWIVDSNTPSGTWHLLRSTDDCEAYCGVPFDQIPIRGGVMEVLDAVDQVTLRPINDRVIITPIKEDESRSLIITPDVAKQKPQRGRVVAAGPGRRSDETGEIIPMSVKAGDIVLYGKYSGSEVPNFQLNGEDVLVMREGEILCVLESE